jgi:hypothetical protein
VKGDNRIILVRFKVQVRYFSLPESVFNGPGALPASYSTDIGVAFSGDKAAATLSVNSAPPNTEINEDNHSCAPAMPLWLVQGLYLHTLTGNKHVGIGLYAECKLR